MSGDSGSASGGSVCWNSAWTLATRTRAGPSARRHAASAATRAADSSRTSSERSYASEVRGSRVTTRSGVAQPGDQLVRDAVRDLRVARDPDERSPLASATAAAR